MNHPASMFQRFGVPCKLSWLRCDTVDPAWPQFPESIYVAMQDLCHQQYQVRTQAAEPAQQSTVLAKSRLDYTILYYTILYYTIPYHTILYSTLLYYTILYYTLLFYSTLLYYRMEAQKRSAAAARWLVFTALSSAATPKTSASGSSSLGSEGPSCHV